MTLSSELTAVFISPTVTITSALRFLRVMQANHLMIMQEQNLKFKHAKKERGSTAELSLPMQ